MTQIINQIYWDEINAGYMTGTNLKKNTNEMVEFKNYLMPSGKTIMKWSSSINYQARKEVPRLPILLSNRTYRLVIDLEEKPVKTVIYCLRFFDLQTNEINNIVFTEKEKKFVYPPNAVSYTFEIINGGCKEIKFRRIQLGESQLSIEAFADFYPTIIKQTEKNKRVVLFLISDTKRAREIADFLLSNSFNFTLIIGYLSWQKSELQLEGLKNLIEQYSNRELIVLSSSKNIKSFLQENENTIFKSSKIISIKNQLENAQKQLFKPEINAINVLDAIKQAVEYLKE